MTYAFFLDLLATCWGLGSALFFSIGVLRLKDESVKAMASSFYNSGEQVAVELAQQKVDFKFGAIFLFSAFFLQLVVKLFPALQMQTVIEHFWLAALIELVIAVATFIFCVWLVIRKREAAELKARAFNA